MRATLAGVLLVTALLTGGCGSEAIPADTAAVLVADSRAIEARLAAGDRCAADRRAQALLRKAEQAIAAGSCRRARGRAAAAHRAPGVHADLPASAPSRSASRGRGRGRG